MSNYYKPLKGISDIKSYTLYNEIQDALIEYFDWALLDIGNFFNVELGEISPDGYDYSRLRTTGSGTYNVGESWEGFRKNWVWQSGVSYSPEPLVGTDNANPGVSGVYVNGDFYQNNTTGEFAHYIDHFNGRVIFDNPISANSIVQAEYSYKWINIVYASNLPWLTQIQKDTLEPNSNFYDRDRGVWNLPPDSRLQLPAIAVEVVPVRKFKGYQLGGGQWVYSDVILHCVAEDEVTRNKLLDIVSLQSDKTIPLFDSNAINDDYKYPLDYRGVPVSGAYRYPEILENYYGGSLRLTNCNVQQMKMIDSNLFGGIVRFSTEGIKTNI